MQAFFTSQTPGTAKPYPGLLTEAVANGANADKIETVGYGESKPIADNGTREGRAKNRRVEIKVELKELKQ